MANQDFNVVKGYQDELGCICARCEDCRFWTADGGCGYDGANGESAWRKYIEECGNDDAYDMTIDEVREFAIAEVLAGHEISDMTDITDDMIEWADAQ